MMNTDNLEPGVYALSFTPVAKHGKADLYFARDAERHVPRAEVPLIGWAVVLHIFEDEKNGEAINDGRYTSIDPVFFYKNDTYTQSQGVEDGLFLRDIRL